jgi:hypothetical protein
MSAAVRPKSGQGSPVAKTGCEARDSQPVLDTNGSGSLSYRVVPGRPVARIPLGGPPAPKPINEANCHGYGYV